MFNCRQTYTGAQTDSGRRVQKFKADYAELKNEFDTIKRENENAVCPQCVLVIDILMYRYQQRAELLSATSIPLSPSVTRRHQTAPTAAPNGFESDSPYASTSRQDHALREHSFIQQTHSDLDGFLDGGRAIIDNLVDQRQILRGQYTLVSIKSCLTLCNIKAHKRRYDHPHKPLGCQETS